MSDAIVIHETGGPEVLCYEEVDVGEPGPGQARVRQTAVGVNFIDTYHRSGLYPLPELPHSIGMEAAGVVEAVGDAVGKDTLRGSLDALTTRGMLVAFGNASGAPDPVDPLELSKRGSLYLTRPSLMDYIATRDELEESAQALFDVVTGGAVEVEVNHRWPLEAAADAHRALEGRKTTGSIVLEP